MDRKFLDGLGLPKEVIDKVLDAHSADIGKHKSQVDSLTSERDGLKAQVDDVAKKLKAFDGIDLDAMKAEINTLKNDMAKKESDYQAKIADRDFSAALNAEIMAAKGKNPKAIMALLDTDKLKTSKNQKEDIAAALKALRESETYLFDDGKTVDKTPAKISTGGSHDESGGNSSPSTNAQMNALITGKLRGE